MATELKRGITKYQAEAFLESIAGWTEVAPSGDSCGARKSPVAVACVEGAIGAGGVPYDTTVYRLFHGGKFDDAELNVLRRFEDYLRDVADHLAEQIQEAASRSKLPESLPTR